MQTANSDERAKQSSKKRRWCEPIEEADKAPGACTHTAAGVIIWYGSVWAATEVDVIKAEPVQWVDCCFSTGCILRYLLFMLHHAST